MSSTCKVGPALAKIQFKWKSQVIAEPHRQSLGNLFLGKVEVGKKQGGVVQGANSGAAGGKQLQKRVCIC